MAVWTHLIFLCFMCTVKQVLSQFISGCTQLDECGNTGFQGFNSPDDVMVCRSLVSYITCAKNARRVCIGDIDYSSVKELVSRLYTQKNCTAILKEITTSVEMAPVTARNSVSAPTRGIPGTDGTRQRPESSHSATDTTPYILSTDRFKITNTQNVDIASTRLKDTDTPTMSSASTNRFEVIETKTTDVTSTRLKDTNTPTMSSASTNRFEVTDNQITEVTSTRFKGTSVPPVSSTERQTPVPSSTASHRETVTEVTAKANQVTWSTTKYASIPSEQTVVRRHPSSTRRVTEVQVSPTDDATVPIPGPTSHMTSTENKTPFKTNIWASLVTNTRTSCVTSPSIIPGLSTERTPGFHQSTKAFPQSTVHTGYETRSSTELKKSRTVPGMFPSTPPEVEEDSPRDASTPLGVELPSSGTDRSLAVSTLSTVTVIWVGWTLLVTNT